MSNQRKATVKAPSNIAFIKYWGKKDEKLRISANSSISMNLSEAFTVTTVEFNPKYEHDIFFFGGKKAVGEEAQRVFKHIDRIRNLAGFSTKAKVVSKNSFPKGTGIASSASGFAALTVAAAKAAGLNLSEKELSIFARIGSGSACRSIPDGFVEWKTGEKSEESYARSLYPPDYWDIKDLVVIVGEADKKVSSSEGHAIAESSPFYKSRIGEMTNKVREIKKALKKKDFTAFGQIIEEEAVNMHAVMMTSKPPLYYWLPKTLEIMLFIEGLRNDGAECYFTIDAGPNVHIICEDRNSDVIMDKVKKNIRGIKNILVNKPSAGAEIL